MTKQQHTISKALAKIEEAHTVLAGMENYLVLDLAKDIEAGILKIKEALEMND